MKRSLTLGIALLIILAVGGIIWSVLYSRGALEPEQNSNMTTLRGQVACLPLKDGTASPSDQCRLGLKNSRGLYLELKGKTNQLVADKTVEITGEMKPADPSSQFTSVGIITVQSIRQQ